MRAVRVLALPATVLALAISHAGLALDAAQAQPAAPAPFKVTMTSLAQEGRQLVWSVKLDHSFPARLAQVRRSLCLMLERAAGGSVSGVLCVGGGPHGPVLRYMHVTAAGRGRARAISAKVSRGAVDQLTASFFPAALGLSYRPLRYQVLSSSASGNCSPAQTHQAAGCQSVFPARPKLVKLHTPIPVGCVASGRPFVYSGPTHRREIALTFDDGPWYDTPQFLSLLEREHVVATFFEIGDQISEYGQGGRIERRMLRDGDMLGNHTWNHPDISGAGAFAASQIDRTAAAIRKATGGFQPCLLRAPYGAVSRALISEARRMGYTTIQWNIDPRDWSLPGVRAIETNVIDNAVPGGIVEMHDGGGNRSETLRALPDIISTLRRRGYAFVNLTQLLGQRVIYR
ncbi:MAG TPA: polysaccharide deacetylase family protein [Solirubrobacteraceae bacterium]|nr:polysaccharide deacetylase family protein [Solirubrobacteraceae bacterium]